jgi:hypothetical protein
VKIHFAPRLENNGSALFIVKVNKVYVIRYALLSSITKHYLKYEYVIIKVQIEKLGN